jgi:hypothetical protein
MPDASSTGGSARAHDFNVRPMLERAVEVRARRVGPTKLVVNLAALDVGHRVPTGDLFRRLELQAEARDAVGKVVVVAPPAALQRSFSVRHGPDGVRRRPVRDTRLLAPGEGSPRSVTLRFSKDVSALDVRYRLVYQRMPTAMATTFGIEPKHNEVLVAEGTLVAEHASEPAQQQANVRD